MPVRRPRIKAAAILPPKRTAKNASGESKNTTNTISVNKSVKVKSESEDKKVEKPENNFNNEPEVSSSYQEARGSEVCPADGLADDFQQNPELIGINYGRPIKGEASEFALQRIEDILEEQESHDLYNDGPLTESIERAEDIVDTSLVKSEFIEEKKSKVSVNISRQEPSLTENIQDVEVPPTAPEPSTPQDENVFKCPQLSAPLRKAEFVSADEHAENAVDESIIKRDLQQLPSDASPLKPRQRIRATPCFGLRRNSIQGSSSDVEDEPRRQRYLSTSSNHSTSMMNVHSHRMRTESSSSCMSDSLNLKDSTRPRKMWVSEESQKLAAAKREFKLQFNGKTPDKSKLKMLDLIYFNPVSNPMKNNTTKIKDRKQSVSSLIVDDAPVKKEEPSPEKNEIAMPVPQLKLGPNGELILDEKSLVIEQTGKSEAWANLANSNVLVYDERSGGQGFYKRHKRSKDWPPEETIKFYRCLHTLGTDFSLMLTLFPTRTRRDLKLKFKKEERNNPNLITKALTFPKIFDIAELKKDLEKEEQEQEEKKKKWAEIKKQMVETKKQRKGKAKTNVSKASRILKDGDCIYANEDVTVPKKKRGRPKIKSEPIASLKKGDENVVAVNNNKNSEDELNYRMDVLLEQNGFIQEGSLPPISTLIRKRKRKEDGSLGDQKGELPVVVDGIPLTDEQLGIEMDILLHDDVSNTTHVQTEDSIYQISHFVPNGSQQLETKNYQILSNELFNDEQISLASEEVLNQEEISMMEDETTMHSDCSTMNQTIIKVEPASNDLRSDAFEISNGYNCDLEHERTIKSEKLLELLNSGSITGEECLRIIQNDFSMNMKSEKPYDIPLESKIMEDVNSNINANTKRAQIDTEKYRNDVNNVLEDLGNGTLVLVASEDPNDETKTINEIFIMCKETGQLSDEPLDLSEDVLNCILEVMN